MEEASLAWLEHTLEIVLDFQDTGGCLFNQLDLQSERRRHLEPWAEFRSVPALLPGSGQGVLSLGSVVCSGTILSCS